MIRLGNIQIEDYSIRQQYYSLFLDGKIDEARSFLNENLNKLNGKVITADILNLFVDKILELENNYINDVISVLSNKKDELQLNINELIYMSDYSNIAQYDINNFVLYNEEIYFCYNKPSIGTLPTDESYWIYLGLRGENGIPPLGVKYVGKWVESTTYSKNQMVVYENMLYVALSNNEKIIPTNTTYWVCAIDNISYPNFYISETEPSGIKTGQIWLEIKQNVT